MATFINAGAPSTIVLAALCTLGSFLVDLRIMLPRQSSDPGLTSLMRAVIDQDLDLITALIDSGADLEARDKLGQNVLYHAFPDEFTDRAVEVLKHLVLCGININASLDGDGCSALVTAVGMDVPEVVQLLIDNGVDINEDAASKFWGSLSSDPAYKNSMVHSSTATTQFIFSKGCGHTVTPLLLAVMEGRTAIIQLLMKANANCESPSHGTFWRASMTSVCSNCDIQVTPLHMAAYLGDLATTYVLLNHKVNMTEYNIAENCRQSFNDITPLWFALLKGHENIVKLFLSLGKPIALPCHFGSGLQVCLEEGHKAIALMILRAGYDLEDDMWWIMDKKFPTSDREVVERIECLAGQPRPLLDWCCSSLRQRFGIHLDQYLAIVGAPRKVSDILNFNDLTSSSWQTDLKKELVQHS